MKERIYEQAADTAIKIRKTLKAAFPGITFAVKSKSNSMGSSVTVRWMDGPLRPDVDAVLKRFQSSYFDSMQDMHILTGYEWEGKIVYGADHIFSSRSLSDERRALIEAKLQKEFEPDRGGFFRWHWDAAERLLIDSGELQGYPSQLLEPIVNAEPERTVSEVPDAAVSAAPEGGKVIPFPVNVFTGSVQFAEPQMESLSSEQLLKLQVLREMHGSENIAELLKFGKFTVDELFKLTAERIFG